MNEAEPQHRIRQWSENRKLTRGTRLVDTQVYLWECWGPGCVKDGKPHRGTVSLFQSKRDIEVKAHKEG